MKATLCDRDKTPITGKPATLTVMLTDGDGTTLFATRDVDLCDECRDTVLGVLRNRVVLKDSNLAAFTSDISHGLLSAPGDKPGPVKAAAPPAAAK